jgi:pSer/pThr/pTyr-binding forkhead associated (FHA) protein
MMELKLIVLAGAKEGTQIPLKKEKFVIGRSRECNLRAGSDAISRRHCAILRTDGAWLVRDLGSRNGTYLNDERIESPSPLGVGDELRVGPLKFRIDEYVKSSGGKPAKAGKATESDLPQDIKRAKQPPVKDVADAVQREAIKGDKSATEDDISRWLLGIVEPTAADMMRETQTLSMEDTAAVVRAVGEQRNGEADVEQDILAADEADLEPAADQSSAEVNSDSSGSGSWKFLKFGKGRADKKKPGKLPKLPDQASRDSCEAAADILREMTRRR